jgi:hypothetical protein
MNFAIRTFGRTLVLLFLYVANIYAHPMPNSEISIRLDETIITLEIKLPVPELVLALPKTVEVTDKNIESYFREHLKILSKDGVSQDYKIASLKIEKSVDEFVGEYRELNLLVEVDVNAEFNPRDFRLEYDAVIHQVPNHFAIVKITQDFNNGILSEEKAVAVGVIRYDFANNKVPPIAVTADDSGIFKGFYNMVALGMHHILVGIDHILFLLTLLIVAPIAVQDGKWSLFEGVGYTIRRFLKISLAFTIGHSAALIFGAYSILPINEKLIEVLIAVSILLTATHAIRPIFAEKEIFVALGFGVIHGLAFSEVLKSLQLSFVPKATAILGFNIGIELMQIIIMAIAFPLLLLSKQKIYHLLRLFFAVVTAIIACIWITERISGKTIIG